MDIEEVKKYFGSQYRAAKELGIHAQNFQIWKKNGKIPMVQQMRIEILTKGALKADKDEFLSVQNKGKK